MKKSLLAFAFLFAILATNAQNSAIRVTKPNIIAKPPTFFTSEVNQNNNYPQINNSTIEPDGEILHTELWGEGRIVEDGSSVLFKQNHKYCPFNEHFSYICGVTFTFLNTDFTVFKEFYMDLPPQTHSVTIMSDFSRTVFNTDSKFEFMVHVHYFEEGLSGPESVRDDLYFLNEDGNRIRPVQTWCDGAFLEYQSADFCKLIMFRIATENYTNDENANTVIEVYKPRPYALEHTFTWKEILMAYVAPGYYFDVLKVDNQSYYFTTHYEKKWCIGYDEYGDPIPDLSNKFLLKLYNMDYTLAKEIKLDIFGIQEHSLSFSNFSTFSNNMKYDLTKNYYTSDNKFVVSYGVSRYNTTMDRELTDYYLVNEDGVILKTLDRNSTNTWTLSPIEGFEDQIVLVVPGGAGGASLNFLNAKTWEFEAVIPGEFEGELLSMNFDRVAMNDSYHYFVGCGKSEPYQDAEYAGIVSFNANGNKVKKYRFLLENDVVYWQPIILGEALKNVFTQDNTLNFMAFTKHQNVGGVGVFNSFDIRNAEDQIIAQFYPKTNYGDVQGAGFVYENLKPKSLYINYLENNGNFINTEFYKLPLIPISVKELEKSNNFIHVYFADNNIRIESELAIKSVEVFDISGRIIYSGNSTKISTTNWKKNIYLVRVTDQIENRFTKKIVVF